MREYIGETRLKRHKRLFRVEEGYEVDLIDGNNEVHTHQFSDKATDKLFELHAGDRVTAVEAAQSLEPYAEELQLNYTYGYKLQMLVQDIMLVLEQQGRLNKHKEGRQYYYHFNDSNQ